MASPDADLRALAERCGVATSYDDFLSRRVEVDATPVRLALQAMGVAAAGPSAVRESLARLRAEEAERIVAPSVVVRADRGGDVALRAGSAGAEAALTLEGGEVVELRAGPRSLRLPAGLATGYHRLHVSVRGAGAEAAVVVAPARCPLPLTEPAWGWMVQLYQARSRASWGMGDYGDLATLGSWAGGLGAAMLLVNPLHAPSPVLPQVDSPYFPASRRFRSPLYLRITDVEEVAGLDADRRERVLALAAQARDANAGDRIHRDAVFRAKAEALELLAAVPRSRARQAAFDAWRRAEGRGAEDFGVYCALAERHGTPWQDWPERLRHPAAPAVTAARGELAGRVEFHAWWPWLSDTQLAEAQRRAPDAGMSVGVIHDLAVGVDPGGADAWALQEDLATTVGAPPDGFNQRGQDWGLPPLLPRRLPATAYAPFRDMLRSVLRAAGGIRIDHVMGLWRLWWVPEGRPASEGTYVRYPADELLGVLALEAERAGAMVVGEDLGTVEEGVRETLADRGVLSSRVLYFEHVDDDPDQPLLPAADYPRLALTSVTTHDLPTAAGWWADEDVKTQTELGLYGSATTPEAQAERKAAERAEMLALLRREGLVPSGPATPTGEQLVAAMHAFLARTPSLLVATGLGDALGDRRQPNMPGTVDEYPNWRLPLARWDDGPVPLHLEDVIDDPRVRQVAALLGERALHASRPLDVP